MDSCCSHGTEPRVRRADEAVEEESEELRRAAETASCLLFLSSAIRGAAAAAVAAAPLPLKGGGYECKTCNRRFSSFQALGGHRASHKRPRFVGEDGDVDGDEQQPHKQRRGKGGGHECAICGLEFAIGQALGGHMRRHRNEAIELTLGAPTAEPTKKVAKKARFLDLNLPPLEDYPTFILA
ncbi:unnamed protein product [Victoria cruziana]